MKSLDYYWSNINAISILLLPLSLVFYIISQLRRLAYKLGIFKSYKSPVPVIVVGNISIGGTGKTPLIIELVKQLQQRNKNPAVISRGYGGQSKSWPQIVNSQTQAQQVGDEPQLIYQHTQCPVVVGPNRKDDIEMLLKEFQCDVILSDDGMQHYALQRDFEICVVDSDRQFGNALLIPAGPLREPKSRLSAVDLVIKNGGANHENSFKMQAMECVPLSDKLSKEKLKFFSGKTVHAIAGIGHPQRFFSMLKNHGVNVIPHVFKDHHNYQSTDLIFDDDLTVLMTEKDAIKCVGMNLNNHWAVPIAIIISQSAQLKVNQIFDWLS